MIIMDEVKNVVKMVYKRWMSKKLFLMLLATVLLWFSKISEDIWQMIAIAYLGVQGVYDTFVTWKGKKEDAVGQKSKEEKEA